MFESDAPHRTMRFPRGKQTSQPTGGPVKRDNHRRLPVKWFFVPWLVALLVGALMAQPVAQDAADVLDRALELAGVERVRLQPDPFLILGGQSREASPPILQTVLADPLGAPYRIGTSERRFVERLDSPHRTFLYAGGLTQANVSRGYIGNPLADIDTRLKAAEDPLAESLEMIAEVAGSYPFADALPDAQVLDGQARYEIARLIAVIASSERFRQRAFRRLPDKLNAAMILPQVIINRFEDFDGDDYRVYIHDIEVEALLAGMLDIQAALEDFDDYVANAGDLPGLDWNVQTPLGRIVLALGPPDSVHAYPDPLLLIDLGGDDKYERIDEGLGRAGISIFYDRAGDDEYWIVPGRGSAAVLGYGVLWDMAGDDRYEGTYVSQAAALLGCAMQWDGGGNDEYIASGYSQAYAVGGCSLLVDIGGDNSFESVLSSQASAGPLASAVLVSTGGNDVYTLKNDPLLDPSPQSRSHNTSLGQGAGTGVRADLSDGRSLPGGVGFLIDTDGNDVYTAQVYCQGVGFLEGTGILVDNAGNDRYTGIWYAQGSGAHRSAGVLIDRAGDDVYHAGLYTSIATGHDSSVGILLDEDGNDSYTVKNLGLGAGNDNGIGMLVDVGGDDVYTIEAGDAYGLGAARIESWGTGRENALSLGLFLDLGGADSYEIRRDGPADGAAWAWPRKYPDLDLPSESGAGVDAEAQSPFHTRPRTEPTDLDDRRLREAREARRTYRNKWPK